MSDIESAPIGYLSYAGDYSLRNTRTLSGVTQLWSDAFARAMADQTADKTSDSVTPTVAAADPVTGEPLGGTNALGQIVDQRELPVNDVQRRPSVPLHLPIAEFELHLLPTPAEPFSVADMIEQQRHLDFDSGWVRPLVLDPHQADANPGPGPQTRPLHLPIAEFEWDLADKPALPLAAETVDEQQRHLNYDNGWARPIILQNLRMAA
ncbi:MULTISPECIES: energy transducer TonB [unclassified Pseudomonas]|uniref:energy transducer TonB n=1 Tax=unclassified Pseudomonas TaxID=196821 RepID=UPI002AC91CE8|nr:MULTISPECIES: energy transducer TonB [unclassified Pseudomonas]MEB0039587.1 energy transducer TonB [Pseudomonas sp. MH10]MEB0077050.1 energy transducer TonB [Pseudomonas sp. MH10out]MEB0089852.1 energy transducer TonB [Pseudomonas sp. CCI4.2]MEB0102728.1 energy transducer TonB [Pseudomonas sp. CCI3.2]MEB0120194.1 energy transducer TonB [Pseudomonas sp. CCI1.2]